MLIAIIILSILLVLSLTVIIMVGIYDGWRTEEWLTVACFVFCLPLWAILKIITYFKHQFNAEKSAILLKCGTIIVPQSS